MSFVYLFSIILCTGIPLCNSLTFPFAAKQARANLTAVVLISDGTEELEAVTTIDLLRRAGMRVTVAGVPGTAAVKCKYGCVLVPDCGLDSALKQGLYDLVVIPGGEQACNTMAQSDKVGRLLTEHVKGERFVAATTSGPVVLDAHRINYLQRLTSAPEFADKLRKHYSYYNWEETIVDEPGKMITGRFSGTILEFGLALINHVADKKTADKVSFGLQPYSSV
ncbi:Parkinson disease protein 7 homolog isoform X1 [Homalodisca vitripennis]|uniref:Parkinson disease protein 7 homolog isoform X1 n=1 Tax=Homalodisca vitripennis TaxID=197043 RepID=UPI001EEA2598|nr:Parkinson disease protein 7 homolog isoform X1 [Homalodisca vitripennis]